jgi:hypothetical protein
MYVKGCPTVDNPAFVSNGITQLALPWALGGYESAGRSTRSSTPGSVTSASARVSPVM